MTDEKQVADLSPRQCLRLQIERDFCSTMGKCELENVARHVLVELCRHNEWDTLLRTHLHGRSDKLYSDWHTTSWQGSHCVETSFDDWVDVSDDGVWFRVQPCFVLAMHHTDPEDDAPHVAAVLAAIKAENKVG